jgi:hypothetical protein
MPDGLHEERGEKSEYSFAENNDHQQQRDEPYELFLSRLEPFKKEIQEAELSASRQKSIFQYHLVDDWLHQIDKNIREKSGKDTEEKRKSQPVFLNEGESEKLEYLFHCSGQRS